MFLNFVSRFTFQHDLNGVHGSTAYKRHPILVAYFKFSSP